MNVTLHTRMLLLALLPTTVVVVVLTAVFLLREIDVIEQGLLTRGAAISRQMATAAEFGLFSGQRGSLSALTDSALSIDPEVRGAAIMHEHGTVMAQSGELHPTSWPGLGRLRGHRLAGGVLLFVEPVQSDSLPVDDIYAGMEAKRPPAPKILGHVVVELTLRDVERRTVRLMILGVMVALLGSALGGWLALRLAHGITKPLLEANDVAARIGAGDLTARMVTASAGALRPLADGINEMAARLGVTQEDLRAQIARATLQFRREKEAAEHATDAKSHFLAAASHDLRQPLHALGLFVAALGQSEAAKQDPKLVAHIQSSVDALQNLLDAILDISRLDGGQVVPKLGNFPVGRVLDRVVQASSAQAEQKGLRLRVRRTGAWVNSDEGIVERILLNLVGNALRYTRTGGVLLACRQRGEKLLVEVWDTGDGIPKQARANIFEEYVQLGNPERDQAKGLGLGLAICRRLAGLLAIPLDVRSRPGRGSVFWIELPKVRPEASGDSGAVAVSRLEEVADPARLSGTVLVVEGDAMVRASMERAIANWGGRVLLAGDREQALRVCRESEHVPDLVICNVRLPGLVSGTSLVQELHKEFRNLAVLMISADVSEDAQMAAQLAGFQLLRQPVPPGRLRAALRHLLSARA